MIQAVDAAGHVGEAEFDALIGPHVELALRLAVTMFTCPVAAGGAVGRAGGPQFPGPVPSCLTGWPAA